MNNNPKRDAYLESVGLELYHLSNERIRDNKPEEVAIILAKVEARRREHRGGVGSSGSVGERGCDGEMHTGQYFPRRAGESHASVLDSAKVEVV